ncbi:hypothetical protein [Corynebacterium sp. CCUG 70398]|uniref:hypothetical protein n=1 Tax=Corynebacterium sp. CCUG 70398 TaxID=2823891 RepID=UPI00210B3FE8|nr:hypothetical protein [Corynebacterium sp. CCUG 70398]MCQ4623192.1 hypothetical protein [Corynebacterium sp. CCUG 70398]
MRSARKLAVATVALVTSMSLMSVAQAEEATDTSEGLSVAPSSLAPSSSVSSSSAKRNADSSSVSSSGSSQSEPEPESDSPDKDTPAPAVLVIEDEVYGKVGNEYKKGIPVESPGMISMPTPAPGIAKKPAPDAVKKPAPDPAPIVVTAVASVLLVFGGMMAVFKSMFPTAKFTVYGMPDGTLEPYQKK